ncbi:homocysteine S-methyltransferase [Glutamicibacter endophyticus]
MSTPASTDSLAAALAANDPRPLLLDGGLGTHLAERGNDITSSLWSAHILRENPHEVRAAHQDFFAAGAQLATTCSYQVSADALATAGLDAAQAPELLRRSVQLARAAAEFDAGTRQRWVAASVGPYGAGPGHGTEYDGAYGLTQGELATWHRPRIASLDAAGADLLLAETVPSLPEVSALLDELAGTKTPAALSLAVRRDETGRGVVLGDGSTLSQVAQVIRERGNLLAVGVNCAPVSVVLEALDILRQELDVPLLAYPNGAEIWDHQARQWRPGGVEPDLPEAVEALLTRGVRLLGGCCRVSPEQISRTSETLTRLTRS